MNGFELTFAVNYLKRLTPAERKAQLRQMLAVLPTEMLDEAIETALAVKGERTPPTRRAPVLGYGRTA